MYWFLNSADPYNRVGKDFLQSIYGWAGAGLLRYDIIYGRKPVFDIIKVMKP